MQTKFGGTVKGESAMVNTSDIGSLVEFTFNVSHFILSGYIRPPGLIAPQTHFLFSTAFLRLYLKLNRNHEVDAIFDGTVKFVFTSRAF